MRLLLLCAVLVLTWTDPVLAQSKKQEMVRCAPDSVAEKLRELMQELRFDSDSSYVEFLPDSAESDLGRKARIIRDLATCRQAHRAFVTGAIESEHWPDRVAVAQVGSFYFIYEGDAELIVVDRNWKVVARLGYGL